MSKRLDPSGLQGAFARRRRATQLDFLVPEKDEAEPAPKVKAAKTKKKKAKTTRKTSAKPKTAKAKATKKPTAKRTKATKTTKRKTSKARASTRRRAVTKPKPQPLSPAAEAIEQPTPTVEAIEQPTPAADTSTAEVPAAATPAPAPRPLTTLGRWTPGRTPWRRPQGLRAHWRWRTRRRVDRLIAQVLARWIS